MEARQLAAELGAVELPEGADGEAAVAALAASTAPAVAAVQAAAARALELTGAPAPPARPVCCLPTRPGCAAAGADASSSSFGVSVAGLLYKSCLNPLDRCANACRSAAQLLPSLEDTSMLVILADGMVWVQHNGKGAS